ncbi:MAG: toxic anion resistance protein [Candidatus Limnocylindrales bacterium]
MSDSLNIDDTSAPAEPGPALAGAPDTVDQAAEPGALTLTPPAAVALVPTEQAAAAVKLDPATVARLDAMAATYIAQITGLDPHDQAFASHVTDIEKLGDEDIKASAAVSSRLLDKPIGAMKHGGLSEASAVSSSLQQLRRQVEDLDPSRQGDLLSPHKLLGILPFGDRLRNYFGKYQSSQGHINAIIDALYRGQDELRKDNADIEGSKANLWAVMDRLRQYIYLGEKLDTALSVRIAGIEATDPERAKVLKEDMLFSVRQKVQDLLTQLAVSVQGYLALDVIRRNNVELIKGVDRATTTTVSALRTAVIVAQALADQKLVLDQITALNTTTSNLIEGTSVLLRQQSGAINEQAASSTIELAKLQTAFDNIYATMDEIDAFKLKALDNMSKTVDALSTGVQKSQTYVDRAQDRTRPAPKQG